MSETPFASSYTGTDGAAIVHYARCWSCMMGQCYEPPMLHDWADYEDVEHYAATGQQDPTGQPCSCRCAGQGTEHFEYVAPADDDRHENDTNMTGGE